MEDASASDPYAVVLADLRAQREKIDQTIQLLEGLRGGTGGNSPSAANLGTPSPASGGPGEFLGMTIVDAAKKLLTRERRKLTNGEIVEAFKRGGYVLNSAEPMNTVGSVLNRRFMQVGDVVRVERGTWGLKEWYPNRTFKAPQPKNPLQEAMSDLSAAVAENAEARRALTDAADVPEAI